MSESLRSCKAVGNASCSGNVAGKVSSLEKSMGRLLALTQRIALPVLRASES